MIIPRLRDRYARLMKEYDTIIKRIINKKYIIINNKNKNKDKLRQIILKQFYGSKGKSEDINRRRRVLKTSSKY
jgi:hypothetical protein